jgi:hypothetical protein
MKKMRGFIMPSPLLLYGALGAALIIGGLTVALKVQTHRLAATKAEYATFVAQTKALGLVAQAKADKQNADFKLLKETVDHETKLNNDRLALAAQRLRDTNTRRSYLPQISATSKRHDLACFDRTEFDAATRDLAGEVSELVVEGEQATVDLDSAKDWIKGWPKQ